MRIPEIKLVLHHYPNDNSAGVKEDITVEGKSSYWFYRLENCVLKKLPTP